MTLSTQQIAARKRVEKERKVNRLCDRLDRFVEKAESLKPKSKGRAAAMAGAEKARAELRELDH